MDKVEEYKKLNEEVDFLIWAYFDYESLPKDIEEKIEKLNHRIKELEKYPEVAEYKRRIEEENRRRMEEIKRRFNEAVRRCSSKKSTKSFALCMANEMKKK